MAVEAAAIRGPSPSGDGNCPTKAIVLETALTRPLNRGGRERLLRRVEEAFAAIPASLALSAD